MLGFRVVESSGLEMLRLQGLIVFGFFGLRDLGLQGFNALEVYTVLGSYGFRLS